MDRRGFLATLVGAILGLKVGPFSIAGPSPEVWKAASFLPRTPHTNQFVPLQQMVAEAVRIVHEETQWLRLKRQHQESTGRGWRHGDTFNLRLPQEFRPAYLYPAPPDWAIMMSRSRPVNMLQQASVRMRFEPDEIRGRSLPEFSDRHVMPAARDLAEEVIKLVRVNGGGEYMVTVDQNMEIEGVPRAAMVLGQAEQLSIRGVHLPPMGPGEHEQVVQLDMLFGLG